MIKGLEYSFMNPDSMTTINKLNTRNCQEKNKKNSKNIKPKTDKR